MPAILAFLASSAGTVFAFLAARIGAKVAILVVLVGVYAAAAATLAGTINGLLSSVMPVMPQILVDGFAMLPTNTDECIAVAVSAEVAAYVYRQIVIVAGIKARI